VTRDIIITTKIIITIIIQEIYCIILNPKRIARKNRPVTRDIIIIIIISTKGQQLFLKTIMETSEVLESRVFLRKVTARMQLRAD
jgi:hypothetical protein